MGEENMVDVKLQRRTDLKASMPKIDLTLRHTLDCRVLPNRRELLRRLPRDGTAAEIGVAFADFTQEILELNAPRKLHLVDAWEGKRCSDGIDVVQDKLRTQIDSKTVEINRGYSTDVLSEFKDGYFDWVYIDTNHSYETTRDELRISSAKVKTAGVIAGHDFCTGNVVSPVPYGVVEACAEFCATFEWKFRYIALDPEGHFSFALERMEAGASSGVNATASGRSLQSKRDLQSQTLSPPADRQAAQAARGIPLTSEAKTSGYWKRRQEMMYYQYVLDIAGPLAAGARSLIDVGSHGTSMAEAFDWIPERVALDLREPYSSPAVTGIKADFFAFAPERRYDMALCLQVLEHVPDAKGFARKLLQVADRVLVSVPYNWPKNRNRFHCQDPVDEKKLAAWFGREPDYTIVVAEPFREDAIARRLIAYFHVPGERFDVKRYRYVKPGRTKA